jgi:hypothetical protein
MTDRLDRVVSHYRIVAAAVTAWLASIPLGAFIHHGIFGAVYAANAAAYRPDPEIIRRLPVGSAGALVGFLVVAYIYAQLHSERRGVVEGLRFGAMVGVVLVTLAAIPNYVMLPISPAAGIAQAVEYLVPAMIYGAIIGAIERVPR